MFVNLSVAIKAKPAVVRFSFRNCIASLLLLLYCIKLRRNIGIASPPLVKRPWLSSVMLSVAARNSCDAFRENVRLLASLVCWL